MGKGKRSKDRKNEEVLQNPSTAAKAPSNKTNTLTKVSLIVIAVILVATLSLVFIQSSGITEWELSTSSISQRHIKKSRQVQVNHEMVTF